MVCVVKRQTWSWVSTERSNRCTSAIMSTTERPRLCRIMAKIQSLNRNFWQTKRAPTNVSKSVYVQKGRFLRSAHWRGVSGNCATCRRNWIIKLENKFVYMIWSAPPKNAGQFSKITFTNHKKLEIERFLLLLNNYEQIYKNTLTSINFSASNSAKRVPTFTGIGVQCSFLYLKVLNKFFIF